MATDTLVVGDSVEIDGVVREVVLKTSKRILLEDKATGKIVTLHIMERLKQ